MRARLLERDAELRRLRAALDRAGRGHGSVALVSGEAGIGKTSLVRELAAGAPSRVRALVGMCDALHRQLAGRPALLVVEDLHWADDATLDVVRWLAWRLPELPCLLVLTYRDDEPGEAAGLRRALGALARQRAQRIGLRRLSAAAVQELSAASGADGGAVLSATGGNPFFVSEVLANPDEPVPATVRDAALARLEGLSDGARRSLELLSTIPGQVERWLAEPLLAEHPAALDEAERRGLLEADPAGVWFRHELARRAIERQLPPTARVACHRQVLAVLAKQPGVELSRLAHHAHQAGEPEEVVRHGLAAAREAAAAGAFSEALAHYDLVLRWSGLLPEEQRATVLEESVWVLYNLSRFEAAVARAREVVRVRERAGDPAMLGQALTTLSRMLYMVNDPGGSQEAARRAVALLEPLGDTHRLARAATYEAAILKLSDRLEEAIARAREALALGEATGQRDVVAHSLNYLGSACSTWATRAGPSTCAARWPRPGPPTTTSTPSAATPTWSRASTAWAASTSWTSRSRPAWPMPAATASPPTSTTWRPTAACC
jgi:predicted ATPase